MIVELLLLGSLIGGLGSESKQNEEPKVSSTTSSTSTSTLVNGVRSSGAQGPALQLVPIQTSSSSVMSSGLTKEAVASLSAKPQNMDEVLGGFAADCAMSSDAVENLKRMAQGQDSLFSPFVKPEKIEVDVQISGVGKKGFAFAMDQTYLGLPLVSMYALKSEGGGLTVGLITKSTLDKAYEAFLAELPSGVLQRLRIENHPTEKNLVELICSV